jgi:7,8-dihydropterin-6-yl-methyl-4-(beta-D-ribofuranosyl)aminobenzene 5'-phosphate synthase
MNRQPTATTTILYDNTAVRPDVTADWGFACTVQTPEATVLFDTGTDQEILLSNMDTLGFAPSDFDVVVISHDHYDHTGGLDAITRANPGITVVIPARFSQSSKDRITRTGAKLRQIEGPTQLVPALHTTGQLGDTIVEQALVLQTSDGLVVITGCAHPGVENMVAAAKAALDGDVALVFGGFHLYDAPADVVTATIQRLKALGAGSVAPCHCSGPLAIEMFATAYTDSFVSVGAGWQNTFAL